MYIWEQELIISYKKYKKKNKTIQNSIQIVKLMMKTKIKSLITITNGKTSLYKHLSL